MKAPITSIIQVIESFEITGIGVIAELQHLFDGLPGGTIIQSTTTHKKWRVNKRVLFHHTAGKQKVFANETPTYPHFSFV